MMEKKNKVETRGQVVLGVEMGSQFKPGCPRRMTPGSQCMREDRRRGESSMRGLGLRAAGRKKGPPVDKTVCGRPSRRPEWERAGVGVGRCGR